MQVECEGQKGAQWLWTTRITIASLAPIVLFVLALVVALKDHALGEHIGEFAVSLSKITLLLGLFAIRAALSHGVSPLWISICAFFCGSPWAIAATLSAGSGF